MPTLRRSAILSGNQAVAEIAEGPIFWLGEQLPDIVIIVTWDTGGYVDWSSADAHPHLYIARLGSEVNLADITGVATNVIEAHGEQRFSFTVASGDATQGSEFDNTTDPLTVAITAGNYPNLNGALVVGDIVHIDAEYLRVTVVAGDNITFARGAEGSSAAVHADAVSIDLSSNPFVTPGQYVAQVVGLFGGKTHRTQRFLIEVLDSVPAP